MNSRLKTLDLINNMRLLVLPRCALKVVLYLLPKFLSKVVSNFLLSHRIGTFLLTAVLLGLGAI